ncbi:amidohydrolase [Pseudomonas linyingensis]|uniref:Amidohydrolase n=1 Tax=Pseudomonas linyingensis TaxID=915471 RepID=A0A1H7ACK3_9PSED|nr:amidohydrolase [Pseudomonas linyingensis]SEJ58725.1 amidohydrolase [Pseudomonas linyingensis]
MKFNSLLLSIMLAFGAVSAAPASSDWVKSAADAVEREVIDLRHHIHQHPELGNQEVKTAALVAEHLRELGIQVRTGVAKTGVIGVLEGGRPGPTIALRADMDALPVEEQTGLPFASKARGTHLGKEVPVMHACGHDAHTAMLLGTAKVLAANKDRIAGTVVFLFQPAEEGAADIDFFDQTQIYGARHMIKDGALDQPKVEAIFGIHVMAQMPSGEIRYKPGAALNSADGFRVTVTGKQTHGSMPWTGADPIVASAQIVNGLQTLVSRRVDLREGMGVVSVGTIQGGSAGNIIPETVSMTGTIRSNSPGIRDSIHSHLPPLVEGIAEANATKAKVELANYAPVTMNDPVLTAAMLPALEKAADGKVGQLSSPSAGSEDFSYYAQKVPGLFVFLGATPAGVEMSKAANNHSPFFAVDDATLKTGVRAHVEFVLRYPQVTEQLAAARNKS